MEENLEGSGTRNDYYSDYKKFNENLKLSCTILDYSLCLVLGFMFLYYSIKESNNIYLFYIR